MSDIRVIKVTGYKGCSGYWDIMYISDMRAIKVNWMLGTLVILGLLGLLRRMQSTILVILGLLELLEYS